MRLDDPRATILNQPGEATPGTVVILTDEAARYSNFWICALSLGYHLPPGSSVKVLMGHDIAGNRNEACADFEGDWIWFIDDDHAFRPDALLSLLARNVDVVQPVCLRRQQPFLPVATSLDGDFLRLADHEPDDLIEVMYAGSSGMLIRRRVIEAVAEPWFELGNGRSEDVNFCEKARAAGFKIHVDAAVRLGHTTVATVWPTWDEDRGAWMTGFTIADGAEIKMGLVDPADYLAAQETAATEAQ